MSFNPLNRGKYTVKTWNPALFQVSVLITIRMFVCLPSLLMPTAMHFLSLQYWQRFRLILRMLHCWFLVQGLYWIFCWILLLKKPCNTSPTSHSQSLLALADSWHTQPMARLRDYWTVNWRDDQPSWPTSRPSTLESEIPLLPPPPSTALPAQFLYLPRYAHGPCALSLPPPGEVSVIGKVGSGSSANDCLTGRSPSLGWFVTLMRNEMKAFPPIGDATANRPSETRLHTCVNVSQGKGMRPRISPKLSGVSRNITY